MDMNRDRQYFNVMLVLKLTGKSVDREVTSFNLDIWLGINEMDQLSCIIVSICLRDVDNCRTFVGILSNRYGCVLTSSASPTKDAHPR